MAQPAVIEGEVSGPKPVAKRKIEALPAKSTEGMGVIERLVMGGASIETIERVIAMNERQEDRNAHTLFLAAFAKLQADLPAVEKKGKGHNDKKYARFEDFIETVRPHLANHGFSLSFRLQHEDAKIRIIGVLGHEGGHQETTDLPLPADKTGNKNDVQSWGSTISYGKRYVGMTLLGTAAEDEDDDGNAAGKKQATPVERITDKQRDELTTLLKRTPEPAANTQTILMFFKAAKLEDLTPAQFVKAKEQLKNRFGL